MGYDPAALRYSIVCLETCVALLILVPLVPILLWKRGRRTATSWKFLLWGALGFLISARVLELGLHVVCLVMDNPVSRFLNGHTWAYVLYGTAAAGIFEEVGRWVILGRVIKKNKTPENAVLYGLGHGGIEVWAVVLVAYLQSLFIALTIQSQGLEAALVTLGVTEVTPAIQAALDAILAFDGGALAANVIERILAVTFHTAATVIVFYGLQKKEKKYLLYAVLAHMLIDAAAGLYQRGACPLWLAEVWLLAWTVPITVWAVKLYRKLTAGTLPAAPAA